MLITALLLASCSVPSEGWKDDVGQDTGSVRSDAPATIIGTLRGADGDGLTLTSVVTSPHGYEAAIPSSGDSFQINDLPSGTYDILARTKSGASSTTSGVVVGAGETATIEIEVDPMDPVDGVVSVEVLAPNGAALEGAVVTCSSGEVATTDADGLAKLSDIGGQTVSIEAADADGALWTRSLEDVEVPKVGAAQVSLQLAGRPAPTDTARSSTLCKECHATVYDAWKATAHGTSVGTELGDALVLHFEAGEVVDLGGPSAWLTTDGTDPVVELTSGGGETRNYPVDGTIGSPDRAAVPFTEIDGVAYPLPIGWVSADPERPGFPDAEERVVPGDVDPWFELSGAWAFEDAPDPSTSAEAACFACHVSGTELTLTTDGGVELSPTSGSGDRWLDGAVGCSRCHGAVASHMGAPSSERSWLVTRPDLLDSERADEVCGQCHARTESIDGDLHFPYTTAKGLFEPGAALSDYATSDPLTWPSGAASAPGQQADEHANSAHGRAGLRCFDCHDPHGEATGSDGEPLPAMLRGDPRDNSLCTSCHLGLSFQGDEAVLAEHPGHVPYPPHYGYDPSGETEMGRCVRCHMPGTSARVAWGELTGSGDQPSHLFVALAPQETVDVFETAGAETLPVGSFPANACLDCHAWNLWRTELEGTGFGGPTGEPTELLTHERMQAAYGVKFP